jgi:hypothetical protein
MYTWTIPAFGATVATNQERDAVVAANAKKQIDYQLAVQAWQAKRDAFLRDSAAYATALITIETNYQAAVARYNQAMVAWRGQSAAQQSAYNAEAAAYGAAKRARDALVAQNQAASARVLGTSPAPPGFAAAGYCVSKAQHDQWVWGCAPVRGLGATDYTCVWQNLPVCNLPPVPVPPRQPAPLPAPVAPTKDAPPRAPTDPGPAPPPPKLAAVPTVSAPPPKPTEPILTVKPQPPPPRPTDNIPVPPSLPPPLPEPPPFPDEQPHASLAVWGILAAVVVVGGGSYYWYTHRKKAA